MLIASNDDELLNWLVNAHDISRANAFIHAVAEAALRACPEDYGILRPALLILKAKYPRYNEPVLHHLERA